MGMSKKNATFIENVNTVLKQRERNSAWLCDKSGLDSGTVSRILRGVVAPSFPAIEAIAEALEVDLSWLLAEHRKGVHAPEDGQIGKRLTQDMEASFDEIYNRLDVLEKKIDVMEMKLNSAIALLKGKK